MNILRFFVIIFVFFFYSCGGVYFSASDYQEYEGETNSDVDSGSGTSNTIPSNNGSSSYVEPAGIPAPVARSVKPISSISIVGTSSEFASEMGLVEIAEEESLIILGEAGSVDSEYFVEISNQEEEEEVIGQFIPNGDGSFVASFPRTLVDFDETLLVRAVDASNNNNKSDPLFVTIHAPSNALDYPTCTVHITELRYIPPKNIEMTSMEDIIFNGLDRKGQPIIYSIPLQGGTPEPRAEGFDSPLSNIQASPDGKFIVGFDSKAGHLLRVDLDGQVTQLTPYPAKDRHFQLSPDGKFVAQKVIVGNNDPILTVVSTKPDPNQPKSVRFDLPDSQLYRTQNLEVNWKGNDQLMVIRELKSPYNTQGDKFRIELINLRNDNLEEYLSFSSPLPLTILTITPSILIQSPFILANLRLNPQDHQLFTFDCGNENKQIEICFKNADNNYERLITRETLGLELGAVQILNNQWNATGELIFYEVVIPGKENSDHLIGAYHPLTTTNDLLVWGSRLKADPLLPNLLSYLSHDDEGQLQVGVLNLALHPLTRDLF